MNKKCLVFAPHQDDEINMIGCIFDVLKDNGYEIIVVFSTNGDFNIKLSLKRSKEAEKVRKILGIDREIYLGYGDTFSGPHIYNHPDIPVKSCAGKTHTYSLREEAEYRFQKNGYHSEYTKNGFKQDISDILEEEMADIIICVDYDSHPDHRALSLTVEETIGELIKKTDYRPIVLKKHAYLGTWDGLPDLFEGTVETVPCENTESSVEDRCYPYLWEDRIQVQTTASIYTHKYWKSKTYKALKAYRTVAGARKYTRIVNSDTIFWYRFTNNLLFHSEVNVSSGEKRYLCDFKMVDSDNVGTQARGMARFNNCYWIPDQNDDQKIVSIVFDKKYHVEEIRIHKWETENSKLKTICLSVNDCPVIHWKCNDNISESIVLGLDDVKQITIRIEDARGTVGIREIEIGEEAIQFPWKDTPFTEYHNTKPSQQNEILLRVYKYLYNISVLFNKVSRFVILIKIMPFSRIVHAVNKRIQRILWRRNK